MKKINIDGVLIVEGKEDVSYLSSFLKSLFFTTNGYDLSKEKIEFLKNAAQRNKLIIFTDSDETGEKIRNSLKSQINPIFEAKCPQIYRKNTKKFGIAESEKSAIIDALSSFTTTDEPKLEKYNLSTLISLSDNPTETREKLFKKYRLINGNNKSFENQLNILRISHKEIEEFCHGN